MRNSSISIGKARNANANATAQSSTGIRNGRSGRPNFATAGAISATLVVHDTSAPRPSRTIDSTVIRRKLSSPPKPMLTDPTVITGSPPAKVAVTPPRSNRIHNHAGTDGRAPRVTPASRAVTSTSTATNAIGIQPG